MRLGRPFPPPDLAGFEISPEAGEACRLLKSEGLLLVVGTNNMVGDRWRDVDCGRAAGCTTVFIDRGYGEQLRSAADFTVSDLLQAADLIKERESAAGGRNRP